MQKMLSNKIFRVVVITVAFLTLIGCAKELKLKIVPQGFLDKDDYQILQSEAEKLTVKVAGGTNEEEISCVPQWVYYVKEDIDFSKINSILIQNYISLDQSADETIIKNTGDELAKVLVDKKLFKTAERSSEAETDIELQGLIIKYKAISGLERTAAFLVGGLKTGWCLMELKLIDHKTREKIGAIQINSLVTVQPVFLGIGALFGEGNPEKAIPEIIATIFENIKNNKRKGALGPHPIYIEDLKMII